MSFIYSFIDRYELSAYIFQALCLDLDTYWCIKLTWSLPLSAQILVTKQIKTMTKCDKNCEENGPGVRPGSTERDYVEGL